MKLLSSQHTHLRLLLFCLLGGIFATSSCGETAPDGDSSAFALAPKGVYRLDGFITDSTPDVSNEAFNETERGLKRRYAEYTALGTTEEERQAKYAEKVEKECGALATEEEQTKCAARMGGFDLLMNQFDPRPASNAVVTLRGVYSNAQTSVDSGGKFCFFGFPEGEYELSAEAPARPPLDGKAWGQMRFRVAHGSGRPHLTISAYAITIKGRVVSADGEPVAGAKVTGGPMFIGDVLYGRVKRSESMQQKKYQYEISAISAEDGSYELHGFNPPNVMQIKGYLAGGTQGLLNEAASQPNELTDFFVGIEVAANGFVQRDVPCVPLVTEPMLGAAQRLWRIMFQISADLTEPQKQDNKFEAKDPLPSSVGNTITGVDIVLEKTEGEK